MLFTISDWTFTRKPSVIASRRQPARLWKKAHWQAQRTGVAALGEAAPSQPADKWFKNSRNHSVERCFYPNRVCEALASPAKTSPFP